MIPTLAAIRFGTGLSPDIAPPTGPEELLRLLSGPDEIAEQFPIRSWERKVAMFREAIGMRRRMKDDPSLAEAYEDLRARSDRDYFRDLGQTLARAALTRNGFRERLTWFWTGHFAVTEGEGYLRRTVGGYVEGAIRPHVAGSYATLLKSAVKHPAMLNYLDQTRSSGPGSPRGRRGGGLNENLAREVLELHTLGAGAEYAQSDVRQLAELLTGLTQSPDGTAKFQPNMVEPGAETVLGTSYGGDAPDPADIDAVLDDLAVHPATARHIARKIARHFISDAPPEEMVEAMTAAWRRTDGQLMAVYGAMLDHPAAWAPEQSKVRLPLDFVAAAVRATGTGQMMADLPYKMLRSQVAMPMMRMGQPWLRPAGPDGWAESASVWITPQGLASRLDWTVALVSSLDPVPDPRAFVEVALGPLAGERTRFAAEAAEDREAGVSLVLAAPEFQRR